MTYAKKCGNRLPHRVNYILDEFGNFAAIDKFQTKMTVAGGYGVRWNLFIQDFNQLIDKYGQEVAKIIQGNCHYWIYLHSQDNSTNEEISKNMGKYTTTTYSLGGSTQKYSAPSSSTNIQLPERILGLFGLLIPLAAVSVITNGFGMGDVKLCAAFGWTLGAFTAYCARAAALTAAGLAGKITHQKRLPLAPFLCGAGMAMILGHI